MGYETKRYIALVRYGNYVEPEGQGDLFLIETDDLEALQSSWGEGRHQVVGVVDSRKGPLGGGQWLEALIESPPQRLRYTLDGGKVRL